MTPLEHAQHLRADASKLQDDAQKKLGEADKLERLTQQYPDLRVYVGRWSKVVYCAKDANPHATHYDMRHNCGCCSDSPLELWPYMMVGEDRIYSDPPCIQIGERSDHGDRPYPGWADKLKQEGLPDELIRVIKGHFRQEKREAMEYLNATMYDDEEEDDDDDT
jgi:hypothetical protein